MPFTPRTTDEIQNALAARVVARTKLTDIGEGSELRFLLEAIAEEFNFIEQRLKGIRDSFNVLAKDISLADFDARILELPQPQIRRTATAAQGAVLSATRASAATAQTLPAGSLVARADGVTYRVVNSVVFAQGTLTVTGIDIACVVQGTAGNAVAGSISKPIQMPSWLVSMANTLPLSNGVDAETLSQAQARIGTYLQSLAHSQPAALQYAALSFKSSAGSVLKFAKGALDTVNAGRYLLVVDDGTGMQGAAKAGATATALVPTTGVRTLWHEAPATAPIAQVAITHNGVTTYLTQGVDYDSIYERGVVRLRPNVFLTAGATWTISNYSVYGGLIAEVQRFLDGDPSDPANFPGWVAAGCRVLVQPPKLHLVSFDVHVVPEQGADLATLANLTLAQTVLWLQTLGPGEPLYVAQLLSWLLQLPGMLNAHVYQSGTGVAYADQYPVETAVIRGDTGTIKVLPTLPS